MARNKKTEIWRDIDIKPLGLYLYDSRGARGFLSYVHQVYEVSQVRETLIPGGDLAPEFRLITRNGAAIYLHEHAELITAFQVASVVVPVLLAACDEVDKKALLAAQSNSKAKKK